MNKIYSLYKSFREKKYAFLLSYTVLFCFFSLLLFWYFPVFHKSFIWQQDGLKQHYNGLLYYSRYLKSIISGVLSGQGISIPMWDFSIGYGSDIITTLNYYAIGDPLTLLSAFVPLSLMEYFYAFLFFLRSYIGGLGFSYMSLSRNNSRFYTLVGALIYCFSAFGLILGLMHGIFMVPVCYFPWVIYGVDRIYKKRSPAVFILSVAFSAAANFYYLYMEVLLAVLYILHKFISEEQDKYLSKQPFSVYMKDFLKRFLEFMVYGINAFLLSAVILLPVLSLLLTSRRLAAEKYVPLLYPFSHYMKLIADFMITKNAGNWTYMGFTAMGALAVILLCTEAFENREIRRLRIRFIVLTVLIMIPAAGFVLTGFAYVANRWVFAYALSVSMITATVLSRTERFDPDRRDRFNKVLLILIWCAAAFFFIRSEESLLSVVILLVSEIVLMNPDLPRGLYKPAVLIILTMSLFLNGWYAYSTADSRFLDEFKDFHAADRLLNDTEFLDLINEQSGDGFFRSEIAGLDRTQNSSIQTGFKGTQFYFSLTSPYISDFINSMYMNWPKDYDYEGVESRTGLEALAAVRYFIAGEESAFEVPSGFTPVKEKEIPAGKAVVYENENALPLGYTVSSVISRSAFDRASVTGRQNALLTGAVIEDKDLSAVRNEGYRETSFEDDSTDILKGIRISGDMDMDENSFTVRNNASVTLTFDAKEDSETYVIFSGLKFEGFKERQRYDQGAWASLTPFEQAKVRDRNTTDGRPSVSSLMVSHDGHGQIVEFYNYKNDYYCGRKNFLVNLGHNLKGEETAVISFREPGVYSFDSLSVRSQNTDSIIEKVKALGGTVMTDVRTDKDSVKGNIRTDSDTLLMLSIPYSTGWKAYVDDRETKLMRADIMYMALPVKEGNHSIVLRYETPYLTAGALLSLIGLLMLFVVLYLSKRRNINTQGK